MHKDLLLTSKGALLLLALLLPIQMVNAQDRTNAGRPNKLDRMRKGVKETVLETIIIEAEVEKPRVALLPKRVEPRFGDIEFVDRSFQRELKKLPKDDLFLDRSLFEPRKIKPVRKLFVKK